MAGDWIKFELATLDKPEVMRMSRELGLSKEAICGFLIRFWGWYSANSTDGNVANVSPADIDMVLSLPGFAEAIKSVGWLTELQDGRLKVPNFDYHNSESAKKRALKTRQKQVERSRANGDKLATSRRPEKRREEITPIAPTGGFLRFWAAWPKGIRKQAQGACWELWRKRDYDLQAEAILAHVDALKKSDDWRKEDGAFVPAPKVYLNQRRWEGADLTPEEVEKKVAL